MTTKILDTWKRRANQLKMETYAIYLAYKDPRVPWYAKILVACIIGYAFSPIDKFLDSIPIIGYLDHLILVPLGVALAFKKMIPPAVLTDCREKARIAMNRKKLYKLGSWFHHHFHVVSLCIVGNRFHNMGYERLEWSTQVVVRVVHENDKIEESHTCTRWGLKGSFGRQRNKSEGE